MKAVWGMTVGTVWLLAVCFLLLLGVVGGTAALVRLLESSAAAERQTTEIRDNLSRLLASLQDAETGQRGYLLTDNANYLAPYDTATRTVGQALAALESSLAGNAAESAELAELKSVITGKMAELKRTIDLHRAGQTAEASAVVRSNVGRTLMDRARQLIRDMRQENSRLLDARRQQLHTVSTRLQVANILAVLAVFAFGTFAIIDARRRNRQLAEINQKLVELAAAQSLLQEQFRQAQKMEVLGQLSGGMAHDFNNMLAVVIGNLNLAQRRLQHGDIAIERFVQHAMEGANRAATLTHRLLAFARNQPLAPAPVDPNTLVDGLADMLRRTLGEAIEIEFVPSAGLWQTDVDAHQLESALVNLAVNARDAMPDGGKLSVETSNAVLDAKYAAQHAEVTAGDYVLIAVSDTGTGMTSEVMAKAFDPFFTTKAVGKGTGLGLSQIYGFVKQSGGHIKMYSEVGHGTTVKLYLPRLAAQGSARRAGKAAAAQEIPFGSPQQVIMVVEDDDQVRRMTVTALRDLRYSVVHAESGGSALRLMDDYPDIALLLTDVVMPEISGRQLADAARQRRPDLKVLYTTGYTRNAIVHNGVVDSDVALIQKPFTLEQLAQKVRQVISEAA